MSPERNQGQTSFEEVISKAKEMMLRDGAHDPILIIDGGGNLAFMQIPDLPESPKEKSWLLQSLGQMAAKNGIAYQLNQVFMVTEGWLSMPNKNDGTEIRPSRDPNRKEVLIISGAQVIEEKKFARIFEILRDRDQHVVELEEVLFKQQQAELTFKVPLLDAFIDGFKGVFRAKYN
jgi:hypothetical protein